MGHLILWYLSLVALTVLSSRTQVLEHWLRAKKCWHSARTSFQAVDGVAKNDTFVTKCVTNVSVTRRTGYQNFYRVCRKRNSSFREIERSVSKSRDGDRESQHRQNRPRVGRPRVRRLQGGRRVVEGSFLQARIRLHQWPRRWRGADN